MTRDPGGSGNYPMPHGNPDGNIHVDTGVWNDAAVAIKINNNASADIAAATMRVTNTALDILNALSFVEGASSLAQALADFSDNIQLSLACVGTDLMVVTSGLEAAARAFAAFDQGLVSTIANLESQVTYFTTQTTLTREGIMPYTPLKIINQTSTSSGGLSISPTAATALGITAGVGITGGAVAAAGGGELLASLLEGLLVVALA